MRRKLLLVAAVSCAVLAAWPVVAHFRAKARLAAYRAELRAQGEKLSITELAPIPSPGAVAAGIDLVLVAAPTLNHSNLPPSLHTITNGLAWAMCREPILPTEDHLDLWPALASTVAENEAAFQTLHAVLEAGEIGFQLNYSQGFNLGLPHLSRIKSPAQRLSAGALYELHACHTDRAFAHLRALARLTSVSCDEPLMISELVRIAISAIALNTTWHALQTQLLSETQWAQLQREWERLHFARQTEAAFAMERAMGELTFRELREKYQDFSNFGTAGANTGLAELAAIGVEIMQDPMAGLRQFAHRYPGYWAWVWWGSYEDELLYAKTTQTAIEAARASAVERTLRATGKPFQERLALVRKQHPKAGRWLGEDLMISGMIERLFERVALMELQRSLLVGAIALERHRLRHGTYPNSLESLAPEFVASTPIDPMDGKPLRYRVSTDGTVLLYSVGIDGEDQDGNPTLDPKKKGWWYARDAVWPRPASPAEVATYLDGLKHFSQKAADYRQRHNLPPAPALEKPATE